MEHTTYASGSGLEDEANLSTAADQAILARVALENPTFAKIVRTKRRMVDWPPPTYAKEWLNHNRMLVTYAGHLRGQDWLHAQGRWLPCRRGAARRARRDRGRPRLAERLARHAAARRRGAGARGSLRLCSSPSKASTGPGSPRRRRCWRRRSRRKAARSFRTREPGGTEVGERVRDMLLHGGDIAPWAEAALFAAARAQLVDEVVRPALARGAVVVCDRFLDSSLAYQGIARGLGLDAVLELNRVVLGGLLPDRTFLLLLPVDEAVQRSTAPPDRIEREGVAFLERVDQAYRELAETFAERIVALDATLAPACNRRPRSGMSFERVLEQEEAKRLLAAALARRPGARLPVPRAARGRQANRGGRVRGRAARRRRPGRAAGAPRPVRARACRRADSHRRDQDAPA